MKKRFLCLSLILAMTAAQAMPVSAARKDEIQAEKSATESKLSQAEANAAALEEKKSALMGEIDTTQQELVSVIAQIDMLTDEITEKEKDIEKTKEDLAKAEAERDEQYAAMCKRIQYMYENGGGETWAQILLESDSIAAMLTKAENTQKVYDYDREELKKMKETVQKVTDLETKLEGEKGELESAKDEQEGMQQSLESKVENLKATASDYETQIANAEAQAAEYRQLIEQQNAELQRIQQEEEAAARAAAEAARRAQEEAAAAAAAQAAAAQAASSSSSSGSSSSASTQSSSSESTYTETVSSESYASSSSSSSATGSQIVAYAEQFIGNPYVYGGNSLTNGIDCSGFTQQVFAHFGYSLPRTSDAQAGSGRAVSWSEHQAGDIIVYPGHVAILTGDGGIVHASNSAPYPQGGIKYTSNALYRSYIAIRRIV